MKTKPETKTMKVLTLLKAIPKGKVTTYGELARAARTSPRAVGQILRRNQWPQTYPCYKVVSSSGKIHGYAGCLTGRNITKKTTMLSKDGISIREGTIDLHKHLHRFSA